MTAKTRAQLKSENASDFPDNSSRLISPADLRGQMDDIVDSAVFPEDGGGGGTPGPAGDVRYAPNIAAMRAMSGLTTGSIIYVGPQMDQFVGVNDASLGPDGGTIFIPNDKLSATQQMVVDLNWYVGSGQENPDNELQLGIWSGDGVGGRAGNTLVTAHTGIDFESVEWVLGDPTAEFPAGETFNIWDLHGHTMSPGYTTRAPGGLPWQADALYALGDMRGNAGHLYKCATAGRSGLYGTSGPTGTGTGIVDGTCTWDISIHDPNAEGSPQLPLIVCDTGRIRDRGGLLTGAGRGAIYPQIRTGGVLVRYRYATSGLRLKRVIQEAIYQLRWWPVTAIEDESGTQINNTDAICWCLNAAAKAKAEVVLIDKMYHYAGALEIPDKVEIRGRGIGISGFKVMDNEAYHELLLSISSAPASIWKEFDYPLYTPRNHKYYYWLWTGRYACSVFPATGARTIKLTGISLDGNIDNNLRIFTWKGPAAPGIDAPADPTLLYAYGVAQDGYLFNTPTYVGFSSSTHGARVINDMDIYLHNVSVRRYNGQGILVSAGARVVQTGVLELGECITGHWLYTADGDYENIRGFGYASGDCMRMRKFVCKNLEATFYPPPDVTFTLNRYPIRPPGPETPPGTWPEPKPDGGDNYTNKDMQLITYGDIIHQHQSVSGKYPWPTLSLHRIWIDHLSFDATALDNYPTGPAYKDGGRYFPAVPFLASGDNIHIKAAKLRFGSKAATTNLIVNGLQLAGHPSRNNIYENIQLEYSSRVSPQLYTNGASLGGFHEAQFRNISFEARGSSHLHNNPDPGTSYLLGSFFFDEAITGDISGIDTAAGYDFADGGRELDFGTLPAASLAGKYIDITPPEGTPVFRLWFEVAGSGTTPSASGVTLVKVTAASSTPAVLAAATALAISGTYPTATAASPYLTSATYGDRCVIGSFSRWNYDRGSIGSWIFADCLNTLTSSIAGVTVLKGVVPIVAKLPTLLNTTGDAWIVESLNTTTPFTPDKVYAWDGAAWVDKGNFPGGVYPRARASHRVYEPSVVSFERITAADPVYSRLVGLKVGAHRNVHMTFKDCIFGAYSCSSILVISGAGNLADSEIAALKDRVHFSFENTIFDMRDGGTGWTNLDLLMYAGKFRNCRVRTPVVATGLTTLGTGFEELLSEESGVITLTPDSAATVFNALQTKLFWVPKVGNVRLFPMNGAAAQVWGTMFPTWWRKAWAATEITDANYYGVNEDRRAPAMKLNFTTAPATALGAIKIGWSAAVSP